MVEKVGSFQIWAKFQEAREIRGIMVSKFTSENVPWELFQESTEHQSTVVKSSCTINDIKIKILFDTGAFDSFISSYALNKYGLATTSKTISYR